MKVGTERSFFDTALVMVGCGMAVFAIGMSLSKPNLSLLLTLGVVLSLALGYWLSRAADRHGLAAADGYLWTVLAIVSIATIWPLNQILPEEGFPFQLIVGGWLCWMILLCGAVSWRDQTLLFLNLPCLAIFGLVGVFDTFPPATIMFFGFLATSTLLYARIHHRSMVRRAQAAGAADVGLLRRDAWRWMAGPEWALVAAAAIVLFSVVGAPLLQFSLRNVSGAVAVQLPATQNRAATSAARVSADSPIGRGPLSPSDRPVFQVRGNNPGYLRLDAYVSYNGGGWNLGRGRSGMVPLLDGEPNPIQDSTYYSPEAQTPSGEVLGWPGGAPEEGPVTGDTETLEIRPFETSLGFLSAPGQIVAVVGIDPDLLQFRSDGGVVHRAGLRAGTTATVRYQAPRLPQGEEPAGLPAPFESSRGTFLTRASIPPEVAGLARLIVPAEGSDYDKALAIRNAIGQRAKYNLRAPVTPAGQDPVEYFLFESKQGYCDLFASSMVLMARAVGIPARYAVGYAVTDPTRDADGFLTVRERDAHAWAEIYFEGVGWVPFDPTEVAEQVPGGERGTSPPPERPWFTAQAGQIAVYVFMGLAVVGAVLSFYGSRRGGAGFAVSGQLAAVARAYTQFQKSVEGRIGRPRRLSETSHEFVEAAAPTLGEALPAARALEGRFSDALYGPSEVTAESATALAVAVKEFRASVAKLPRDGGEA